MNTMQEGIDKAIANNVESIVFYVKEGMTKERAMAVQRPHSCMSDKIWEQISQQVDEYIGNTDQVVLCPLTRMENLIVAKLWQKGVKDLGDTELDYAFEAVGRPAYCKNVALQLIERGMTIDGLYRLFPDVYEDNKPHVFSS